MQKFIYNVTVLIVENTLLYGIADIFTAARVQNMRIEPGKFWLLEALGGETDEVVQERRNITDELTTLTDALKKCEACLGVQTMKLAQRSYRDEKQAPSQKPHTVSRDMFTTPKASVNRSPLSGSYSSPASASSSTTTLSVTSYDGSPKKNAFLPLRNRMALSTQTSDELNNDSDDDEI
jgi:hypothetical protein